MELIENAMSKANDKRSHPTSSILKRLLNGIEQCACLNHFKPGFCFAVVVVLGVFFLSLCRSLSVLLSFSWFHDLCQRGKRFWIGSSCKRKIQFEFMRSQANYICNARKCLDLKCDSNLCWRSTGTRKVLWASIHRIHGVFVYNHKHTYIYTYTHTNRGAKNKATINIVETTLVHKHISVYRTNAPYKPLNEFRYCIQRHTKTHSLNSHSKDHTIAIWKVIFA